MENSHELDLINTYCLGLNGDRHRLQSNIKIPRQRDNEGMHLSRDCRASHTSVDCLWSICSDQNISSCGSSGQKETRVDARLRTSARLKIFHCKQRLVFELHPDHSCLAVDTDVTVVNLHCCCNLSSDDVAHDATGDLPHFCAGALKLHVNSDVLCRTG
jgi:hypothetical protein